jgi:hypothetical protein
MTPDASTKKSLSFYELQQLTRPASPVLAYDDSSPLPDERRRRKPVPPKLPAPAPEPTLSVYLTTDSAGYQGCTCTLSKALLAQLPNLKTNTPVSCGTRVLLVAPGRRGGKWYLDTRPKPGAGVCFTLNKSGGAAARIQPISKTHFQCTVSQRDNGGRDWASTTNTLVRRIKLKLGPELVDNPGYYRLLPLELKPQAQPDQEEHPQSW